MTLRVSSLPHTRDRMAKLLGDANSSLRASVSERGGLADHQKYEAIARHLQAGALYAVTKDMAALASHAAETLPTVRWTAEDRPSPTGLIVWDGGIGNLPIRTRGGTKDGAEWALLTGDNSGVTYLPVAATSWGPHPDGVVVMRWMERSFIQERMRGTRPESELDTEAVPPLIPFADTVVDTSVLEQPADSLPHDVVTLAAAWRLMQQPTLVERQRGEVDKKRKAAYARQGRPEPEVTVIDLRRAYVPDDAEETDSEGRRIYSHRWVVGGHWRDQAHGPNWSQRRRIWIPDYVKGPEGAPLLARERVHVWRR